MLAERHNALQRLFRGETSFDFVGRWRRWFSISGIIIAIGLVSLATRGLNFSIDFKGGTVWEVPSTASVSDARSVVGSAVPGFGQATIVILTNTQTRQRTVKVEAPANLTADSAKVSAVTNALAKMAGVSPNDVQLNDVGPSWGSDITDKAIRAVIIFLIVVTGYIWLRFEGKMALAALVALVHDILLTLGIYSLSGFQVSPDTVIAFLTVLGYSLYDTIVVFDKVQENTRGLASTNRLTYSDTVNLSMNQVLARSINTSLVAILPILSILVIGAWVLGATALQDFGLALFVGLTTGAYSSIFIASPLLALLKEREPRYAEIRRRLAATPTAQSRRITPAAAATGDLSGTVAVAAVPAAAGSGRRAGGRSGRTAVGERSDASALTEDDEGKAAVSESDNGTAVPAPAPTDSSAPATAAPSPAPGSTVAPGAGTGATGERPRRPPRAPPTGRRPDRERRAGAAKSRRPSGPRRTSLRRQPGRGHRPGRPIVRSSDRDPVRWRHGGHARLAEGFDPGYPGLSAARRGLQRHHPAAGQRPGPELVRRGARPGLPTPGHRQSDRRSRRAASSWLRPSQSTWARDSFRSAKPASCPGT